MVRQFSQAYAARCAGQAAALPRTRPYREHIRWLSRQDLGRAQAYWRRAFEGCDRAPASAARRRGRGATAAAGPQDDGGVVLRLRTRDDAAARGRAAQKLTLNTLVQGAWALLVSGHRQLRHRCSASPCRGGRPRSSGIERWSACSSTPLPLRTRSIPRRRSRRGSPTCNAAVRSCAVRPARSCRSAPGRRSGVRGRCSIRCSPSRTIPSPPRSRGGCGRELRRTHELPVSAAVVPGPRLHLRLLYHRQRLAHRTVQHLGAQFERCSAARWQPAAAGASVSSICDRCRPHARRGRQSHPAALPGAGHAGRTLGEQVLAHPGHRRWCSVPAAPGLRRARLPGQRAGAAAQRERRRARNPGRRASRALGGIRRRGARRRQDRRLLRADGRSTARLRGCTRCCATSAPGWC